MQGGNTQETTTRMRRNEVGSFFSCLNRRERLSGPKNLKITYEIEPFALGIRPHRLRPHQQHSYSNHPLIIMAGVRKHPLNLPGIVSSHYYLLMIMIFFMFFYNYSLRYQKMIITSIHSLTILSNFYLIIF